MKKIYLAAVIAATSAVLAPVQAQSLSFNLGVVSLYKSNGVDQDSRDSTNTRLALQGGVDYSFANGLYVGNWNSTGNFGGADIEIDLYGGYASEFANGISYDVGVARYIYPSNNEAGWNGTEGYASISYSIATFKVTRGLSDSYKNMSRYSVTLAQPVNDQLSLRLVLGDRNKKAGGHNDFGLGANYLLGDGMTLTAMYSGAGKKDDGTKPSSHNSRLVVGVSKSF
jgi:uncharacterized protein (TIGR02001 family)